MSAPPQFAAAYHYDSNVVGVSSVRASAAAIVPIINDLFHPESVIDLGCGAGDWLSVWSEIAGCSIRGFDGAWVPKSSLCIQSSSFNTAEFCTKVPDLGSADLAMCLEVAEHVPDITGKEFVAALCQAAPIVVWSAAVPGQGGYGHINERYQDYWVREFAGHGFKPFDLIRPQIWMNSAVSWWYQQNLLIFASESAIQRFQLAACPMTVSIVHPALYEQNRDPKNYSFRKMIPNILFYLLKGIDFIKSNSGLIRRS